MKHEITKLPDMKVLFIRKTGSYGKVAAEAWGALMKFADSRHLMSKKTKLIGISHDDPGITPEHKFRYDACITIGKEVKAEGASALRTIKGGTYAVFLHKGPHERLRETYGEIFSVWLPSSGETLRETPPFEVYLNRDCSRTKPENLRTEIYVPLK